MTNTYDEMEPINVKMFEEIRCLRCVNERILRAMDEGLFVDYQMEKFSGSSVARAKVDKDESIVGLGVMTTKQNPYDIDAMNCISHAATLGVSLEEYTEKVALMARKKVRIICKGLRKDD